MCGIFSGSHCASQLPDWLLRFGVQSKRRYTFGPHVETLEGWWGAEGQEGQAANSYHWESRLLRGPSGPASWPGSLESKVWKGSLRGVRGCATRWFLTLLQAAADAIMLPLLSGCIIAAFQEHCRKCRPELQFSEVRKMVSAPKLMGVFVFSEAPSENRLLKQ